MIRRTPAATQTRKATKANRATETTTAEPAAGGAVVALAFDAGRRLHAIDGDGRVVELADDGTALTVRRVLHDAPREPATALASFADGVVVATGKRLLAFGADGAVRARGAAAKGPIAALAVRNGAVFALGGGFVTRYDLEGSTFVAATPVKHGAGEAFDLDVDDDAGRALVLRDRTRVEILDLKKRRSLHEWTRKPVGGGRVDAVGARFQPGKDAVLSVTDDMGRLSRVATKSGRPTAEVLWPLESQRLGPLVLDASRRTAAIGATGEDVEVVDLDPPRSRFFLAAAITDAQEKALSSMVRLPRFKQLGPGLWARSGSDPAPPTPRTQTAIAVDDGGHHVAAGFASGEVLLADTTRARIVSSQRGTLADGRCRIVLPKPDLVATGIRGVELWLVGLDRTRIIDLATQTLREGPRLELPAAATGIFDHAGTLSFADGLFTWFGDTELIRFDPATGQARSRVALGDARWCGSFLHGDELVYLDEADLAVDGFVLRALDLRTGRVRERGRFVRDPVRFPFGDPGWKGWVRLGSLGRHPTITLWPGKGMVVAQTHLFDPDTLTVGVRRLPWESDSAEGTVLTTETEESDGVVVRDLITGEELRRVPFAPGERYRSRGRYDATSSTIASTVSSSEIGVWDRAGARRFTLPGHRDGSVFALAEGGEGLASVDRFWLRVWDLR